MNEPAFRPVCTDDVPTRTVAEEAESAFQPECVRPTGRAGDPPPNPNPEPNVSSVPEGTHTVRRDPAAQIRRSIGPLSGG